MFGFSIGVVIAAAICFALVFYGFINIKWTDTGFTIREKVRAWLKDTFKTGGPE